MNSATGRGTLQGSVRPARRPCQRVALAAVGLQQQLADCRAELDATRRALAISLLRESQAVQVAAQDALTGLPNRRALDLRASNELQWHASRDRAFCVLYIDLDDFKAVNDSLGHAAGDLLLQVIGARLKHVVRREDFVSRQGGDEFVCVLHEMQDETKAWALAHKLIKALAAPCQLGPDTVTVQASVGLALYPRDGLSMQELLAHADQALHSAKQHRQPLRLVR